LLASIECGRIGFEATEVIAPFLIYPLLRDLVDIDNSPIPDFADAEKKIADLTAKNAKLSEENAYLRDQNAKINTHKDP
jgi:hypothetical protein